MLKIEEMCVNLHPNLNETVLMRLIKPICMLLTALLVMSSCLNSKDSDATLYNDAAIVSFTLGNLNRYLHTTTAAGNDSVYKVTVTGSAYTFHIDQLNHRIYNTDSLPTNTDVKHVLCTIGTINNGRVIIKDMESDTLRYFVSTDSIDFSKPRTFYVMASDGSGGSEYTISVNAHQEEAEGFVWEQMAMSSELATFPIVKSTVFNGIPMLIGEVNGIQKLFTFEDGVIEEIPEQPILKPEGIKEWIGQTSSETYALSVDDKLMVSLDNGNTWFEDQTDENVAMLPVRDLSFVCYPMDLASNTDYAVMVGNRSLENYPEESIAMVWRKIVDDDQYTPDGRWYYMERSDDNRMALPRLANLSITKYDDAIVAIGGKGIGGSTYPAYYEIYESRDNGINWQSTKRFKLPDNFDRSATSVALAVDSDEYLWMFCSGTGQIWRGQLNRLGWEYQ